ncbi:DEHA2E23584p [Debaryomyces hansenii CBS767]|uniref:DEHA2E23584p n=1 Tax=Debaryomyces hansenii (strain ATCC 36239 / CBS 767 / BCRC 21394 / JCM 1990 / NBRC 0083 / IGC 2968) TaxID=284592 RepID=Q6BN95_DEBHA|nr:DEHA2E23584p [Debaryomyces hansenii CBS767]CAG88609.2 DEHA2E23584p [Debaryomyces hansenii CBS767]|eukprot:XP_460325.2 DEHA2E23584p [Debaryomyces hansenii CBS767]
MVSDKLFWWGTGILIVGLSAGFIHIIYLDILHKQKMVSGIIEEMLIPEFINKRPFREIDHSKREKILKDILKSVNSNVSCRMGTDNLDYRDYYKNTASLLKTYNCRISRFEEKYLEHYKDMPVEEIRGWDKVMLVAKNLQDDDLNFAYDNVAPPDLINKYSTRKPIIAPKDSGTSMEEIVSKNNSYEIA